jgi:hypothetical protein
LTQPAGKLAKRKGWTQYIDVSAIDPLTLSVQILRNIHGGGERLTRKLTIAQLELRRNEDNRCEDTAASNNLFNSYQFVFLPRNQSKA